MSLQPKVIGLIFVVFLIYGVLNYTAQFWLILPSFAALEREQAAKNMDRVVQVIERETRHLAIVAADWAMRDDTYQFVQDRYETYVKKELDDVAIQNLKVNLMCFFDRARNKVWEITFDLGEKAAIPIEVFPATLPEGHPLAALSKPDSEVTGILITEQGPALVAAKPVVTSKNQGPVRGTLVMGRFLDTAAIATQAQAPLTVSWVQDAGLSSELSAAIAELGGSSRSLIHEGADQNRVYRVLPDILGRPALLLQINVPKTIFARGQAAVDFALLSLLGAGLIILIVLVISMRYLVLVPIYRLIVHIVAVAQKGDQVDRLTLLERQDEFGVLAQEFDRMFERLTETRKALIDQSYRSGVAEMASGILHNVGNAMTPLTVHVSSLNTAIHNAPVAELRMTLNELADAHTPPDRRADLEQFLVLVGQEMVALLDGAVEQLSKVDQQITYMQQILSEQERFSRSHRVLESLPVAELVRESLQLFSAELHRQIHIKPSPELPTVGAVVGSRVALQQILINLLKNAVAAVKARSLPPGIGHIAVDASLEYNDSGDCVHLRVSDNGIGLSPESLPRIFERGFSTKGRNASGIGLHWCAITTLAMGGTLYAESTGVGQGACLHLILPHASVLSTGN